VAAPLLAHAILDGDLARIELTGSTCNMPAQHPEEAVAAPHRPVMVAEVVRLLLADRTGRPLRLVDLTLGDGGHAAALLEAAPAGSELLGIDRDAQAVARSRATLSRFGERVRTVHARFAELGAVLDERRWDRIDAAVADLGVSSLQLDLPERGFSFRHAAALDMRMDPSRGETAAGLLERASCDELTTILRELGEEPRARAIARAIVRARDAAEAPLTTAALRAIVAGAAKSRERRAIDPATRTFQALRIAVNRELEELAALLVTLPGRLAPGGRVAILSYHSLEDRPVKQAFRGWSATCVCPPELPRCVCGGVARARDLTRHALRPGDEEVAANPRARSARLRAIEWLGTGSSHAR